MWKKWVSMFWNKMQRLGRWACWKIEHSNLIDLFRNTWRLIFRTFTCLLFLHLDHWNTFSRTFHLSFLKCFPQSNSLKTILTRDQVTVGLCFPAASLIMVSKCCQRSQVSSYVIHKNAAPTEHCECWLQINRCTLISQCLGLCSTHQKMSKDVWYFFNGQSWGGLFRSQMARI